MISMEKIIPYGGDKEKCIVRYRQRHVDFFWYGIGKGMSIMDPEDVGVSCYDSCGSSFVFLLVSPFVQGAVGLSKHTLFLFIPPCGGRMRVGKRGKRRTIVRLRM